MKFSRIAFTISILALLSTNGWSQLSQLLPLEMKTALQNGTRSMTGEPGINYWQNYSVYKIKAELLPNESVLKGDEQVVYFNNSPDSLKSIVIRLYQDIYKKGNARQFGMGRDAVNDGVKIYRLKVGGKTIDLNDSRASYKTPTNLIIPLDVPLSPDDSLLIEAKWEYEISSLRPIRNGNYGNDFFFIAYWYPQIAVYDDIDGWDRVDYLGLVEFYNDFNKYEVEIKTPGNYLVWATGTLQNEEDIYSKQVLKSLEKARNSKDVQTVFTAEDCRKNNVLNRKENSWLFTADGVPDFSFAMATNVNWEGSSLVVEDEPERRVFVDAVYADSSRTFEKTALWARNSVKYMSFEWPGYPFPYSHMTTFNNGRRGGGMESPMMANNGDPTNPPSAAATVFHEIAHTYFPFFMGTNERKYAWMDEGWAANLPIGYMDAYFPDYNYLARYLSTFENINGKEREMTLMTLSNSAGYYDSYRVHAYVRPAFAYHFLRDALGDSIFKTALHYYIERWNGKHPIPYDFFNTFSNVTNQDLSWYFIPWFFEKAVADQAIKKVTLDNKVVVENVGGLPMPVVLTIEYEDGTSEVIRESTNVWSSGENAVILQGSTDLTIKEVLLGSDRIPDVDRMNNSMTPVYK